MSSKRVTFDQGEMDRIWQLAVVLHAHKGLGLAAALAEAAVSFYSFTQMMYAPASFHVHEPGRFLLARTPDYGAFVSRTEGGGFEVTLEWEAE